MRPCHYQLKWELLPSFSLSLQKITKNWFLQNCLHKFIHVSLTHGHTHTHTHSFPSFSLLPTLSLISSLISPSFLCTQLENHLAMKSGDCPLDEVDCPFKVYGCSFVVCSSTEWSILNEHCRYGISFRTAHWCLSHCTVLYRVPCQYLQIFSKQISRCIK